jgi:hypothetical protein
MHYAASAPTMPRRCLLIGAAAALGALLSSVPARAQTTVGIVATSQINPDRLVKGQVKPQRPQNLNPLGLNYQDCVDDMTLQFNLQGMNFDGTQIVEVWAGVTDCTQDSARGLTGVISCWPVYQPFAGQAGTSPPLPIPVRVQDLLSHEFDTNLSRTYARAGADVCAKQTVDTATSVSVYFMATVSGYIVMNSQAYSYAIKADLLGPPAPAGFSIADGDTLFVLNWTANSEADTAAYNVYIDPYPGQEEAGSSNTPQADCPGMSVDASDADVGASTGTGDDGAVSDDSAASDDMTSSSSSSSSSGSAGAPDACHTLVSAGSASGNNCGSPALATAPIVNLGAGTVTTVEDDSGDEAGTTTVVGGGGIGNLPTTLLYPPGLGASDVSISDKTTSSFTISGLTNGLYYNVAIASVDGSGNIGPQSVQQCDFPAPVDDFWKTYRQAGGSAGGGLCALEGVGEPAPAAAGLGLVAAALALRVRRKRRG